MLDDFCFIAFIAFFHRSFSFAQVPCRLHRAHAAGVRDAVTKLLRLSLMFDVAVTLAQGPSFDL